MAKTNSTVRPVRLALVGAETLLGRELQDVLQNRAAGVVIQTYASSGEGSFGEQEGEAVYVEHLDAHTIEPHDVLVTAGTRDGAMKAYELAKAAGGRPPIIDCTGVLEQQPEARILAPLVREPEQTGHWLSVAAHPAASALAMILEGLVRGAPVEKSIAHVFEPASERGKPGVSELHQQTTSLLSFKTLEKSVFDAQLSFNLLAAYGEEAPTSLAFVEQRIEKHLATILSGRTGREFVPMPSLRLIQAPVFHGYSISLWIEFQSHVNATEIAEALASAQIEIRAENQEIPTNVGAASQSGLMVGDIRPDRNNARAAWLWIVADNLRLLADTAVEIVNEVKVSRR